MAVRTKFPLQESDFADLREVMRKYVIPGYAPREPFLDRTGAVISMGSCFAQNIHRTLTAASIPSAWLNLSETINTPPFALVTMQALRGLDTSLIGHMPPNVLTDEGLAAARALLPTAQAFILTLGVAMQPFHEDGKPTFHISKSGYHGTNWRLLTVDEVLNYTRSIIHSIRAMKPGIPVVVTLSPIPVTNSVGHESVFGQDCESKSILRVAIMHLMEEAIPDVYYWPSFEVVRWVSGHMRPFFGGIGALDMRHIPSTLLATIMEVFIEAYFKP